VKPSVALEKHREAVRAAFQRYPTIANPRVFGSVLPTELPKYFRDEVMVEATPL